MIDHFKKFAKAYSAGAAVLVVGPYAADIVVLIVWGLSLAHVTVSDAAQAALAHLLTGIASGGAAAVATNSQS